MMIYAFVSALWLSSSLSSTQRYYCFIILFLVPIERFVYFHFRFGPVLSCTGFRVSLPHFNPCIHGSPTLKNLDTANI